MVSTCSFADCRWCCGRCLSTRSICGLRPGSTGSLKRPVADVLDTSIVKIAGLWATWAVIAAIYALCRFYWAPQLLFSMAMFSAAAIPLVILLSVPYVVWLDRYLSEPRDGAWHVGAWIAGRADWDAHEIFHHLRAWAVKGFFLAFMISIVPGGWRDIVNMDFAAVLTNPVALANALITAMFLVDVQFATVGYMLTCKPLDAHIRTANPYLAGWVAALMCYPPFILMNNGGPLDYHIGTSDWAYWFEGADRTALDMGSAMLVVLTGIYAWRDGRIRAALSRTSRDRGILTHGPLCLHQAPRLSEQERLLVAGDDAVPCHHRQHRRHDPQHRDPRFGQRHLLLAGQDRREASDG